jgi:hypothetical protein
MAHPYESDQQHHRSQLERFDFLIAAPYADKLPLKVAEYIRKDIPFAILIPLPLLNEIDRISKTEIDQLRKSAKNACR